MDIRLFSIEAAPRTLPVWELILDDLGRPPAHRIARTLGVGVSTVYRWNSAGHAPRMACLALFWLTRWGRSEIDCRATNDAMTAVALARSLNEERATLRGQLAQSETDRERLASMVSRFQKAARETLGHGSAAIAGRSHTDSHYAGSWGAGWSLAWQAPRVVGAPVVGTVEKPLNWPRLADPSPEPGAASPDRSTEVAACPPEGDASEPRARPGSHGAPPPEDHSPRGQERQRSDAPQGAADQEAERSCLPCHHSATIQTPSAKLLELRQAPALRAERATARISASAPVGIEADSSLQDGASQGAQARTAARQDRTTRPTPEHRHQPSGGIQKGGPLATWGSAPVPARSVFATLVATLAPSTTERTAP